MSAPDESASKPGVKISRSVMVAFQVLEAVAEHQPIGVGELARRTSLPKSTVQRALKTLEAAGMVHASGDTTVWGLTLRVFGLGQRALAGFDMSEQARPALRSLHEATQETVSVSVFDTRRALIVDCIDSVYPVRAVVEPGVEIPLHVSAAGKAYLAAMPPERLEQYLTTPFPLESPTQFSITDAQAIRDEIDATRKRGYAVNARESHPDIIAIGAIASGQQGPLAGLVVAIPRPRVTAARTREFGALVVKHARTLTEVLGGQG